MKRRATIGAMFGACTLTVAAPAADRFDPARPFLFTTTTARPAEGRWTAHYDTGYAERTDVPFGYDGLEQRIGVQGSLGHGFTLLGQIGLGVAGDAGAQSTQEAELLKDMLGPARGLRLAVGLGVRREWEGTKALLGRISLGHAFGRSTIHGNMRLERPFAGGRDEVDLITTLGWLRRVSPAVGLGVEVMGEDLEGLWDAKEAEGGARFFVGPSLHVAPPERRFHLTLGGGPIVRASRSNRTSAAPRALGGKNGYTVRMSAGYSF